MSATTPAESCKAEFTCHAPEATCVSLVGSFNEWDARANPLSRRVDGEWAVVLELAPGFYHYKFVVDGRWCCEHRETRPSEACAGHGCCGDRCVPNAYGTMDRVKVVG